MNASSVVLGLRFNPNADPGQMTERGHCEVHELEDISTQIRH